MRPALSIVTLYNSPSDKPGYFVARRFYGEFATQDHFSHAQIAPVWQWAQETIERFNCSQAVRLMRDDADHPCVIESWI